MKTVSTKDLLSMSSNDLDNENLSDNISCSSKIQWDYPDTQDKFKDESSDYSAEINRAT